MSQYDFGTIDPNTKSGTALATDLNSWRNALHSTHGGSTAPTYITAGMLWLDTTSANYELKLYDGAQSITVAIIDATNNVARVAVDPLETSYITSTTNGQIRHLIASIDVLTVRSTGLQFNIASPYIGDSSNNELVSFTTTASAVNQINVANAATATNPVISAVGNDTNIGITLTPKGTGRTNIGQLALDGTTITTTAAQLNFVTGVTSAIQTQMDAKAPLASPALTGTPTAPTAAVGTNTTQLATTAFVLAAPKVQILSERTVLNTQTFNTSGTWTKPGSGTYAVVEAWGAGGSGRRGGGSSSQGGGGGGAYVKTVFLLSALTATVVVTIGAGGAASTVAFTGGFQGGDTTFGAYLTSYGGSGNYFSNGTGGGGGGGGSAGTQPAFNTGTGGIAGPLAASITDFLVTSVDGYANPVTLGFAGPGGNAGGASAYGGGGGGSGTGTAGGDSAYGGGGGGGASSTVGGAGGISTFGGSGSAGQTGTAASAAGTQPGGGSGGTYNGNTGKGGDGRVIVTVY